MGWATASARPAGMGGGVGWDAPGTGVAGVVTALAGVEPVSFAVGIGLLLGGGVAGGITLGGTQGGAIGVFLGGAESAGEGTLRVRWSLLLRRGVYVWWRW